MADLKENAITVLSSTLIADMELDAPTLYSLYTVPPGKQLVLDAIIVHSNAATLVGMTDVNFGGGVAAITPVWANAVSLTGLTVANSHIHIRQLSSVDRIMIDGDDATLLDRVVRMEVIAGATTATTAIVDVLGYLVAS